MSTQNDPSQNNDDSALILAMDIWGDPDMRTAAACALEALKEAGWLVVRPAQRLRDAEAELAAALELIGKQPDVVAVKLPEPSYVDEPEVGAKGYGFNGDAGDRHLSERGVYAHDGMVYDQWDSVSPDDARKIGSWWLAAAARAEAADGAQ